MPDQSSETTLSQWVGKTLTGWEEIRQALVFVDSLPAEKRNGARVEVYDHPQDRTYTDPNGYRRYSDSDILVHRHIAEIYVIRRKLRKNEVVHHINGNKLDNRPKNLEVMTWKRHKRLHRR